MYYNGINHIIKETQILGPIAFTLENNLSSLNSVQTKLNRNRIFLYMNK